MITRNEQYVKEMIGIMEEMQQYVPTVKKNINVKTAGKEYEVQYDIVHPILFGGDQMTAKNARSAKLSKSCETTALRRLEGLEHVFEDWHARACLLEVSYGLHCHTY